MMDWLTKWKTLLLVAALVLIAILYAAGPLQATIGNQQCAADAVLKQLHLALFGNSEVSHFLVGPGETVQFEDGRRIVIPKDVPYRFFTAYDGYRWYVIASGNLDDDAAEDIRYISESGFIRCKSDDAIETLSLDAFRPPNSRW